ncbi:MAG: ABA4-like family protein [Candidatus Hydrogenedentes bacterium]|nr:ABA4-like family protein [Candidatus Hydrogenedentota bacterium]
MSLEGIFSACSTLVMAGWLLLVFLPRWKWAASLICGVIIPLALGVAYLVLIALYFRGAEGGFGSLADVGTMFRNPGMLLAGWIHYLAFDLFIGSWEVRDAQRLGIHHLLVIPCLFLTFMLGPIGLLAYFVLRVAIKRKVFIVENEAA